MNFPTTQEDISELSKKLIQNPKEKLFARFRLKSNSDFDIYCSASIQFTNCKIE